MAEDPRGKRRKQAKPRRNHGSHFDVTENVESPLNQEPSITEGSMGTPVGTPDAEQPALVCDSPEETKEAHKEDEGLGANTWASPSTKDHNPAVAEEEGLSRRGSGDFSTCIGTSVTYPRVPEEAVRRGSPEGQEAGRKFEALKVFSQLLHCPHCKQEYRSSISLSDHIRDHHKPEGNFTCPLCGHTVQFEVQLELHMALHSAQLTNSNTSEHIQPLSGQSPDNRKFKCPECGKSFKYKHHLKEHIRIHSGEKPYECSHCKKRFSHSGSYSSHLNNKKCLAPTQASNTHPGSSPTSGSRPRSPGEPSFSPSPGLQHNSHKEQNGHDLGHRHPRNSKARNISMQCFGSGPSRRWVDFPWNELHRTLPDLPVGFSGASHATSLGHKVDYLFGHVNSSNGRRTNFQIMQDLKCRFGMRPLETNDDRHEYPSKPSLASMELQHGESTTENHSPWGDFRCLKSNGNSTVEECVTMDDRQALHQRQQWKDPCKVLDETNVCTANTGRPCYAQTHNKKGGDRGRHHYGQQGAQSQFSLKELNQETKSQGTAGSPPHKMQCVETQPQPSTIGHHNLAHNHSTLLALNNPKLSSYGVPTTLNGSTSDGTQAEPLDLSLPRLCKQLPLVSWSNQNHNKQVSLTTQEDLIVHKPSSLSELRPDSLCPPPLFTTFPDLLPTTLNNLLQERFPILQMNSNFQGLHFLPYMSYIYGAESGYLLPNTLQHKYRQLGEFFGLAEQPSPGEDTEDGDSSPMRKRLKKTEEGLYACDLCDKTFQKSSSLLRHKYEHTGKRPHQCEICQKAFKHKHHLIEHSRLHSGEKPYQCNKCGKRFSHSGSYSQHMNHRYAYCRKDDASEFLEDHLAIPRSVEESPERMHSPSRVSGSRLADPEVPNPCHQYENGVTVNPNYAKGPGQDLLQNMVP
ncbi:zinc finger E-box-binding homeobox 1-like [Pleurodeles waltl]|uniref:zinc finger E-box-binding homeobox 1-like n=1 Tax=Pleurodeles waltl TaxID=8319 RepID=UPI0037093D05